MKNYYLFILILAGNYALPIYAGKRICTYDATLTFAAALSNKKPDKIIRNNGKGLLNCSKLAMTSLDGIKKYKFNKLHHLDFSHNLLTDLCELLHIKNFSVLTIDLSNNHFDSIDGADLNQLLTNFAALNYINLENNPLTVKNIISIKNMLKQHLEYHAVKITFPKLNAK